jgi:hypothetical protein
VGAREGGGGPQYAAVEPRIDELDVAVVDKVGPARALPEGVLDGNVCRDLNERRLRPRLLLSLAY